VDADPVTGMSVIKKPKSKKIARTLSSKVLTVPEVADYLHLDPSTVYRLAKQGRIPAFRVGGKWRFELRHLKRWMERKSIRAR